MACKIYVNDSEVVPQLTRMCLPRAELIEILEMTIGERRNVMASDPLTTGGTEIWRWGTRFSRENLVLRELGWVRCRHNQIEGIRNDTIKIKLAVINTDSYTGIPSKLPRNNAGKGPSAVRLVENNSTQVAFAFIDGSVDHPIDAYDFFYFCIHAGEQYVSAEISRPNLIVGETIRDFSDRIILRQPGEMDGLARRDPVPEDFAKVDKPIIKRKE